ncbi:PhzF family phenazine biosynthesis protein [Halomarina oriensis]|uniref:PhzF family phenazine biosynthesis isomerase n=1 Tax=Halomarina oriensis TaxID=671145 RepID=A0A6B0GKS7_9EURY|nr:PhzF family phenazine biosynthesis protein [Halomarina oriensis]MWG35472.1 PhzF family phenazine biosynthesis isomerase [Halomarina oriensis]
MDTRRALIVDAFTTDALTGNAAGLVPDADGLDADQMQAVARELHASETAFLTDSEEADRRIRYFTPETEVDLCGHATIASHAFLHQAEAIDAGTHTLSTNVGVLDVEVAADGSVWMTQAPPEAHDVDVSYEEVAAAVGVDLDALTDLEADLPLGWASTGLGFLCVPVTYLDELGGADPDMAAVEALCEEVDATGVYAFTFDTIDPDATLHGRMFAPGAGVPEDPCTGTASGAVTAYLRAHDALDSYADLVYEQGHFLDRPGRIRVRAAEEIRVGGRAVVSLDGELAIPDADDEDIVVA